MTKNEFLVSAELELKHCLIAEGSMQKYINDLTKAYDAGAFQQKEINKELVDENEWHLTKNELPELQTGNEYSDLVLCFRYYINNHGKKIKVYDLDRWNSENDIWEISGMKKDQIEAWMYLPEPPEEI